MRETLSNSAAVIFIDRDRILADLRDAAGRAKARYPEIRRVLLVGSLTRDDWTADSDADLVVVVEPAPAGLLERAPYQIFTASIPTDTLVYSQAEFARLAAEPGSPLAEALRLAIEL